MSRSAENRKYSPPQHWWKGEIQKLSEDTPWSEIPHGGSRNGWLFALDDGRRMILTRCAVVDKPESQEFPMDQGVIDAMATVSDQIATGSIAHFLVDSGRTEMACGPGDFPHVARTTEDNPLCLMEMTEVLRADSGEVGIARDGELVTVTLDVTDAVRVIFGVRKLAKRENASDIRAPRRKHPKYDSYPRTGQPVV